MLQSFCHPSVRTNRLLQFAPIHLVNVSVTQVDFVAHHKKMISRNCSSSSVLMTVFSSGTSITRRGISGALDKFFSWKWSQTEYLSVTPVAGWTSSCDFSPPKENWNVFRIFKPCTQGKWRTKPKCPYFTAVIFSSVGGTSLPLFAGTAEGEGLVGL